ncbi:MAG: VWA domain-containing protein [Enhygromyxa sp.]
MRQLHYFAPILAVSLLPACNLAKPVSEVHEPLTWGDAEWPEAPIPQPGGNGSDDGSGGSTTGGSSTGGSFVPADDLGGSSQCDPFAQDCPEGEKCVAYASAGGSLDANKCVPVNGEAMPGEPCSYAGVVEATDDCDASSYCWDVSDSTGTCAQFCQGVADAPQCPEGFDCLLAYSGALNLCLDEDAEDPGMPDLSEPALSFRDQQLDLTCPDDPEPVVLYMSNDDSNSQASPVIVRRLIHDGLLVDQSRVRIHEFLNYYTITTDYPADKPAALGMQMRRTNAKTGEFTLLLTAKGQQLRDEQRPPLNLVFSLDTSGSMGGERLELVKASMLALAGELRAGDVISLVEWSSNQAVLLEGHAVNGADDPALVAAVEGLQATGGTDLHGGLIAAYELAELHRVEGGINRVIIMSDGGANAGVTDLSLIADAAAAEDGSGIYLVGVGVGTANGYRDDLMDALTDAGKGAYIFIDDPAEAALQFTDRFLSNVDVAARNVRMRVTLPWYFAIKAFHGEEYSADPAKVEPQHLAPNDAMSFHQILAACDPDSIDPSDSVEAHIEYLHPTTLEPSSESLSLELGELVAADATELYKADVVVNFAKAIIVIDAFMDQGKQAEALGAAQDMQSWLAAAAEQLGDPEVVEMAALMGEYSLVIAN